MEATLERFNKVVWQINGMYHDICRTLGIADSDFDILYVICVQGDGCNQSMLYKNLGHKKTTINSSIKRMREQGYLSVEQGTGRNTRIFLTEAGKELSAKTVEKIIRMENEIFGTWSAEDQEIMIELNQRYLDGMKERIGALIPKEADEA